MKLFRKKKSTWPGEERRLPQNAGERLRREKELREKKTQELEAVQKTVDETGERIARIQAVVRALTPR